MFRRIFASLVGVSAALAMTSSVLAAPIPKLQSGSKVFIAPMAGFETYFRAATKAATLPLVFVRTRAEADYEITGLTKQVPSDEAENVADFRTTRQETAVRITRIDSGEEVFRHSVRTLVRSPNDEDCPLDDAQPNAEPAARPRERNGCSAVRASLARCAGRTNTMTFLDRRPRNEDLFGPRGRRLLATSCIQRIGVQRYVNRGGVGST